MLRLVRQQLTREGHGETSVMGILGVHRFRSLALLAALTLAFLYAKPAQAESNAADVYGWIMNMGRITFNSGGGAFLPTGVLNAMRYGQISPIMQFVTMNHLLNQCIANSLRPQIVPRLRDPYLVAQKKFQYGLCMVKKCWQNGMLVSLLPTLSRGGAEDNSQLASLLAASFQKDPACDGSGGGGLDPNLLVLLGLGGG